MTLPKAMREQMSAWAKLGGIARAKALSPARRKAIARKAVAAREAKRNANA